MASTVYETEISVVETSCYFTIVNFLPLIFDLLINCCKTIERLVSANSAKYKTELLIHFTSEYFMEKNGRLLHFNIQIFSGWNKKVLDLTSNGPVTSSSCAVR